jgi:dienelactone hydrolase
MRSSLVAVIFFLSLFCSATRGTTVEKSICGRLREPLMFSIWRRVAQAVDSGIPPRHGAPYTFHTTDGRVLRGYKLSVGNDIARGAVVFIQGNAMTVATIADELLPLAKAGYDVYALDFRGYGKSEGTPRMAALLSDYRQLVSSLRSSGYGRIFVYGCSLGGVIAANLIEANVDAIVIDSVPATVQSFGCPSELDPINHLAVSCSKVLLIAGGKDRLVPPDKISPLLKKGEACGATIVEEPGWGHPFMGPELDFPLRLRKVIKFLSRF